jgi:methylated-DNA-[protein]-cysteine S-methyltransferase
MASPHFTLFDTPIGSCGLVWNDHGLIGVLLPEASPTATRARVKRRYPDVIEAAPSPQMQPIIARIEGLLRGASDDLLDVELDMSAVPDFDRSVYDIARRIRPGATRTYGEIAVELGDVHIARAVGKALGENPFPIIVPCHRVLGAGGKAGGFSANGGTRTKLRLLEIEGAPLGGSPGLFD